MPQFIYQINYTSHGGDWEPFDDGVTSGVQILSGNTGSITWSTPVIGGGWRLEPEGYAIQHDSNDLPAGFTVIDYTINSEPNPTIVPGTIGLDVEAFRNPETVDVPHLPISIPISTTIEYTPSPGESYRIVAVPYGTDPWLQVPMGGFMGTYELSLYTWSLNKEAARPGDEVSITSSGDPVTGPDLTEVENIHLLWDDPDLGPQDRLITTDEFIEWTVFLIIIELPEDIPDDTEVTIVPTIFGGSVPIGTLTVYIANSSGMYKIVRDQNDDVKYIASHGTDEVEHVKIPDPYFRTGYIGG